MKNETKAKILVIVGPTASGKTSLSVKLASHFNGEIISADSRQVYTGLNIGSGKITEKEMGGIPHHLLDIIDPNNVYTAADFERDGFRVITDILARHKLPIIAGGTFFYIDTLLGKSSVPEVPANEILRQELESKNIDELNAQLQLKDPVRASNIDTRNKRRIIRALEIIDAIGSVPPIESEDRFNVFTIGILVDKEDLHQNIHTRLIERIENGMVEEVERLHNEGVSWERLEKFGLEYRYIALFLQDKLSKKEMLTTLELQIQHFAKRQMTWLKRDEHIHWFHKDEYEKIEEEIKKFLNT